MDLFWTIAVVLIVLWFLGVVVFPVGGALINLLLVIALILIIVRLSRGQPL